MLLYIVAYLATDSADVRKMPLADGPSRADPCLLCLSSAFAGSFFSEYYDVAGGSSAYYIRYARIRRKGGCVLIPTHVLSITHYFLYAKNVIPVNGVKVIRLCTAVRVFFENLFLDEKNIIKNETDKNKTDENKAEDEAESENETE